MEKLIINCEKKDKIANILCQKGFSYNYVCKLLRNKDIRIDDIKIKDNIEVEQGCKITVFYSAVELQKTMEIVYQDDNIIIVNKPASIEVEGHDGVAERLNAYAVHRLDRNTQGLLILAKTQEAKKILLQAFKDRVVEKRYLAEVIGSTHFDGKELSAYLVKDSSQSQVKIYDKKVKGAVLIINKFKTLKSTSASSIVECELITGKTHQIRAHLAYLGHPIIGDGKYGKNIDNKKYKQKYQMLHCYYIKFRNLAGSLTYLNGQSFVEYPNFYKKS